MRKWISLGLLCAVAPLAAATGPVWSSIGSMPSTASNVIFPIYDSSRSLLFAIWIDDVNYSPAKGFSSSFDGTGWSSLFETPVNGVFINVMPGTYDATLGKIVACWTDAAFSPMSSSFDGSSWSSAQSIPTSGNGAIVPFPSYCPTLSKTIALWNEPTTGTYICSSSLFDGSSWSTTPQTHPGTNAFVTYPTSVGGQVLSVWVDFATSIAYSSIFDGANWSTAQVVATNVNAPNSVPTLTTSCSSLLDGVLVTWADATTFQIFSSVFDGTSWSTPVAISGSTANSSQAAFSAEDCALGKIVTVWDDSSLGQAAYSLYDGSAWTAAQVIPDSPGGSSISMAYDPALGKLVALWIDSTSHLGYYSIFYVPSITFLGSGNLARLANYINQVGQTATMQPILALLIGMSQDAMTDALASISNGRNAFMPWTAASTAFSFAQIMEGRSSERRLLGRRLNPSLPPLAHLTASAELLAGAVQPPVGSAQTAAHGDQPYAFWAEGLGTLAHQKAQDQNPAYDANTAGTMLGFDYYGAKAHLFTSAAYAHTLIKDAGKAGYHDIDSYALSLYGIGFKGDAFLEGGLSTVYCLNKSDRHISFPGFDAHAKATFSSYQAVPHLSLGYDFQWTNWILEPYMSANLALLFQDEFAETGADPLNIDQLSSSSGLFQSRFGLRAYLSDTPDWGLWLIRFAASYQYKKGIGIGTIKDAFFVGQDPGFTVISLNEAQNGFIPSLEIFIRGNNGVFASVNYDGEFSFHYHSNSLQAKLGYFW